MVDHLSIPQAKAKQGLSLSGPLVDPLTPNYGVVDVCVRHRAFLARENPPE